MSGCTASQVVSMTLERIKQTSYIPYSGVGNKAERTEGVSVCMLAKNQNNNGGVHGSDCRYENINI